MLLVEQDPVQERNLEWARDAQSNYCAFGYKRDGEWYGWVCSPGYRRECLKSISLYGGHPELSLDYDDAATITERVRQVVPVDCFTPAEVEPAVVKRFADTEPAGGPEQMLGLVMLWTMVVGAGFIYLVIRAMG